jgi:hypothetical protein
MLDRPTPRPRPVPAPDTGTDPTEHRAPALYPVPPSRRRPGPEPVATLNTRVSLDLDALITEVAEARRWSRRTVVEHALRETYTAR